MGKELKSQTVQLEDINAKTADLQVPLSPSAEHLSRSIFDIACGQVRTERADQKVVKMIEKMGSCKKYGIMVGLALLFILLLFLTIYV